MEANAISLPPAPPVLETDGENPCRIDITDVAMDTVTLLICLCGLVGNGAVLWFLGFRISRNPITTYILNLAMANFTFLLFMVTSVLLYMMENIFCFSFETLTYQRPLFLLSLLSYNMGLYLLMAISIERCSSILCPLWYRCHRPQRLSALVCVLLWALSITVIAAVTSLCLLHEDDHCRVALISMYVLNFLIFAPPMVASNVILFIKVQCGSQQRQPKRLYIVIFLTVLFFLIFGVPLSVWNFLLQFGFAAVPSQAVFLLACINSSINPFIYFLVGSCRRRCSVVPLQVAFRRVFGEPEDNIDFSRDTTMNTLASAY
ncbi:mas-related G-protein coupled receptor member H-like [Pezoporus flaviventris]|uniref:mas-related G-protein coupled receptor member H-like n=1 Tax=Pezoporus flaviventris TaxID=889875 RepID=UPI002AB10CFD|nr:mas-related G-protein coupled receptor member H-like [Pezoporus flaviventris]XP_061299566.1 mas-related G-protein coupled receptor member H-like [Pezoporus flaviventris]XP_061299567.1 mas-related G-protein coupled receptor member H-like [Pezoporus flaviventris]